MDSSLTKLILGPISYLGEDQTGMFAPSVNGRIGVKVSDGVYYDFDDGKLNNVGGAVLTVSKVYRVPVEPGEVKKGDVVLCSDNPPAPWFVIEEFDKDEGTFEAINPVDHSRAKYSPATNVTGEPFIVVLKSLFDIAGKGGSLNPAVLLALAGPRGGNGGGVGAPAASPGGQPTGSSSPSGGGIDVSALLAAGVLGKGKLSLFGKNMNPALLLALGKGGIDANTLILSGLLTGKEKKGEEKKQEGA